MPANRNALLRYKTIDKCLQNRLRLWTLDDLIDECSDALYEYEGIDKGVSRRTIQGDLHLMRSDKLGYNAPIIVKQKKYYTYEDKDYSITNIPITDQDLNRLNETVALLKQFKGFSHFQDLDVMIQKLEDHVHAKKSKHAPVIDLEKNENLKGLGFLDQIYQSIIKQNILLINYQSFRARQASEFNFKPLLLKEFRNRWFLLGYREDHNQIYNLALDRIENLQATEQFFYLKEPFDANTYFKHTIGVTVNNIPPMEVILYILHRHAPYVLTKPLHWSQKEVSRDNYGVTISIRVQHNFELEKEILGLGEYIRVISPEKLKRVIKERLSAGIDFYQTELSEKGIQNAIKLFQYKGHSIINHVYTKREVSKINKEVFKLRQDKKMNPHDIIKLEMEAPNLLPLLLNQNLTDLVNTLSNKLVFQSAEYYSFSTQESCCNNWTQYNIENNTVILKVHLDDTTNSLDDIQVIPGSHKTLLTKEKIQTITQNAIPKSIKVLQGGLHIIDSLLLQYYPTQKNPKKRRMVLLRFGY